MSSWDKTKKLKINIYKKGTAYRKTHILKTLFKSFSIHSSKIEIPKRTVLSASMTLEALFIFPLFLFFSIILINVINLINFQNRINEIMYDSSRNLSKLEYVVSGSANQATALAMLWSEIGNDTTKGMGITAGNLGLISLNSDFDKDEVDFVINYVAKTPFDFLNVLDFSCCQRAAVRKWIGDEDKGDEKNADNANDSMVFITESGTVYHLDRNCTHIRLSIKSVSGIQIGDLRNSSGGKYYPCEKCGTTIKQSSNWYITDTGTKYHSDINCSGLKRGVFSVPLSEVEGRTACSRCGK